MDFIAIIAEEKIREALQNGDLDDNPLRGRPLQFDDLSGVPEHLRIAYKLLKDAGVLPEELQLKNDIAALKQEILSCKSDDALRRLKKALHQKALQYRVMVELKNTRRR